MTKERYYQYKAVGRCIQCGAPASDGIYCDVCKIRKYDNEDQREQAKRYKLTHNNNELDQMAKEAHEKHLTYGRLQEMKIIEKTRRET